MFEKPGCINDCINSVQNITKVTKNAFVAGLSFEF